MALIFPGLPLKKVYDKRFLLSKKVIGTNGNLWSTAKRNAPILKRSKVMGSSGTPPSGKIQILSPLSMRSCALLKTACLLLALPRSTKIQLRL